MLGDFIKPGEQRRLGQSDEARALAEIFLRGRFHSVGARAVVDPVEIEFEDLVLGIFALEPERQDRLLDLARHCPLLGQEQVLRQLLGQRRAALDRPAAGDIAHHRAADADRIDAHVRVEAPVLDGDKRFRQVGRQVYETDGRAAGVAAIGEERSVVSKDRDVGRPLGHGELVDRRELARTIGDDSSECDHGPNAEHEGPVDRAPEQTASSPSAPLGFGD